MSHISNNYKVNSNISKLLKIRNPEKITKMDEKIHYLESAISVLTTKILAYKRKTNGLNGKILRKMEDDLKILKQEKTRLSP